MLKDHNAVTPVRLEPAALRSRMVHCISVYTKGLHIMIYFAEYYFGIANSVDPDEMSHNAAFHLGLKRTKESLV